MTSSDEQKRRRDRINASIKAAGSRSKAGPSRKQQLGELHGLAGQIERQRARAHAFGASTPEAHSPSLLGRVLDVISRPSYAVNEFLRSSLEERHKGGGGFLGLGSLDEGLSGAVQGLEGKKKTAFADYLKEQGMPGGWQRTVAGLVGDVVADPTTYLGVGVVGDAAKVEKAAAEAGKAAQAAFEVERVATRGARAAAKRTIRNDMIAAARAAGTKIPAHEIAAAVKAVDDDLLETGVRLAREQVAAARAANAPKVALKIHGHEVIASQRAYRGVAAVGDIIGRAPGLEPILKGISTARSFPGGIHTAKNIHEAQGAFHLREGLKDIKAAFHGTDRAAREELFNYITHGTLHSDPHMQDLITKTRSVLEDISNSKVHELGEIGKVFDPTALPVVYRKGGHLRALKGSFDAEEAARLGYHQVKDVATLLGWEVMHHQRELTKFNMASQIANEFGVDASKSKLGAEMARRSLLTDNVSRMPYMPPNTFFDRDVASGIRKVVDTISSDEEMKQIARTFDKVQGTFKFLVTAPSPGFHMRNLMGDVWNNWLDGVTDPTMYRKALHVVTDKFGPTELRLNKAMKVSSSEIKRLYEGQGLRSGFIRAEADILPANITRAAQKPGQLIRDFSETREDFGRMAHFMDALKKEYNKAPKGLNHGQKLEHAAEIAANRVRKFNFDYNDFTHFEKTVLRRMVPFYSWTRKNLPLQLEMLMTHPGRMALAPKGLRAIAQLTGTDPNADPMPGLDNVIPQWVIDSAMPMLQQGSDTQDPKFLNVKLPFSDIGDYFEGVDEFAGGLAKGDFNWNALTEGPGRAILSQTSPFARVPFELVQGNQMFSGAPIQDKTQYLLQQFGFLGREASNQLAPRPPEKKGGVIEINIAGHKLRIPEALWSSLVGVGPRSVTPQMMKGELRRQQDVIQQIISAARERASGG